MRSTKETSVHTLIWFSGRSREKSRSSSLSIKCEGRIVEIAHLKQLYYVCRAYDDKIRLYHIILGPTGAKFETTSKVTT